jgi:hypothetical protein
MARTIPRPSARAALVRPVRASHRPASSIFTISVTAPWTSAVIATATTARTDSRASAWLAGLPRCLITTWPHTGGAALAVKSPASGESRLFRAAGA